MGTKSNVVVIGLWHLGTVSAACFAAYGHRVIGIDPSKEVIASLRKGSPPIYEPGLTELIKKNVKNGRLSFTNDFKSGLKDAEYVVIAFDTPIKEDDTPDLSPILQSVADSVPHLSDGVLLVIGSQVPIGTCEQIRSTIQKKRPGLDFSIVCTPENLRLGEAISRFNSPDFLVIGTSNEKDFKNAEKLFGFVAGPKLRMSLRSAEMSKHALNAFLACEVSFANEIGNLCDGLNADSFGVAEALHLDRRIGKNALLRPGLGFAGGTLARDVGILRALGKKNGIDTLLLDAVMNVNRGQNLIIGTKLRLIFGKVKGLRIGVLGLTYKPGTSAIRRSASIDIIKELVSEGASVKAYDPKAEFNKATLGVKFERCENAAAVAESANVLLLLTAWPEFGDLDFARLRSRMLHPVIIDAANMLNPDDMRSRGFLYIGIGRGERIKAIPPEGKGGPSRNRK